LGDRKFQKDQTRRHQGRSAVDIEIDSIARTYPGHVDSIQAGSGTAFSLSPAENATGDDVKVVQCIPYENHIRPPAGRRNRPRHVWRTHREDAKMMFAAALGLQLATRRWPFPKARRQTPSDA
jgi:multidrug resistance efflux pump